MRITTTDNPGLLRPVTLAAGTNNLTFPNPPAGVPVTAQEHRQRMSCKPADYFQVRMHTRLNTSAA